MQNYLFDRRFEQVPEAKSAAALAADVESFCCVCRSPCSYYRGAYHCAGWLANTKSSCHIPVIVCKACAHAGPDLSTLRCPLCEEGYYAPQAKPDLVELRRALGPVEGAAAGGLPRAGGKRKHEEVRAAHDAAKAPSTRIYVGNLPYVLSAAELRQVLLAALRGEGPPPAPGTKAAKRWRKEQRRRARDGATPATSECGDGVVVAVRWLKDANSGLFYGAALVEMSTVAAAAALVAAAAPTRGLLLTDAPSDGDGGQWGGGMPLGLKLRGRRLRVHFAPLAAGEEAMWPPAPDEERERPPVGSSLGLGAGSQ